MFYGENRMNLLIQELRDGEILYEKGSEEGELFAIKRPPTKLALQAANRIEVLENTLENLSLSYNSLLAAHDNLQQTCNLQYESICELTEKLQAGKQTQPLEPTNERLNGSDTSLEPTTEHQS